jgi:hypothetical protein
MARARQSYAEKIIARVPDEFPKLVGQAAARSFISPSAYVRQALSEKLTRDGLPVSQASSDASVTDRAAAA